MFLRYLSRLKRQSRHAREYDYTEIMIYMQWNDATLGTIANDIVDINSYFDNFENWLKYVDYKDEYDFQRKSIDTEDYFYIENKEICEKHANYPDKFSAYSAYNVYFFDTQTKTLYFIHSNI